MLRVKKYLLLTVLLMVMVTIAAQCVVAPAQESAAPAAEKSPPKVVVMNSWSRPSPMQAGNGAVYMTLMNEGGQPDVLLSVETDVAEVVELHETKMEGDVMKMGPISSIEIPAGGSINLEPGGRHIMLINLKQQLTPGEKIKLILNFEKSGQKTIEVEIRELGASLSTTLLGSSTMDMDKDNGIFLITNNFFKEFFT